MIVLLLNIFFFNYFFSFTIKHQLGSLISLSSVDGMEYTIFYTTNDFSLGFNCNKLMKNTLLVSDFDANVSIPHSYFRK